MPYYLSKTKDQDAATQKHGWTDIARYVRSIDRYQHPITIHPSSTARQSVDDPAVLDFDMLQTGHSDRRSLPNTVAKVRRVLRSRTQDARPRRRSLLRRHPASQPRRGAAHHVLGLHPQRRRRPHLWRQRHLASQHRGSPVRPLTARPFLGRHPLGHRLPTPRLRPNSASPKHSSPATRGGASNPIPNGPTPPGLRKTCSSPSPPESPENCASSTYPTGIPPSSATSNQASPIGPSFGIPSTPKKPPSVPSPPTPKANGPPPAALSSRTGSSSYKRPDLHLQ